MSWFRKWAKTAQSVKWLGGGWMDWGWIWGGARGFSLLQNIQISSGAHPASNSVRTTVLSHGSSGRPFIKVTTDLHLVPEARVHGAVPLLLLFIFIVWTETIVPLCLWFRNVTPALNKDWLQFCVLQASYDAHFEIFRCGPYLVTYQQNWITIWKHFQIG